MINLENILMLGFGLGIAAIAIAIIWCLVIFIGDHDDDNC